MICSVLEVFDDLLTASFGHHVLEVDLSVETIDPEQEVLDDLLTVFVGYPVPFDGLWIAFLSYPAWEGDLSVALVDRQA